MSLNTIQLTPQLLVGLYADVLVETQVAATAPKPAINFLGSNQKHLLIVVADKEEPYITDNELTFLTSILAACKFAIADVAIINKEHLQNVTYDTIIGALQSKIILLFNVDPLAFGLPINFPPFQIQQFNTRTYLYAPSLKEIEQDKGLKSKLWMNLKTLFSL